MNPYLSVSALVGLLIVIGAFVWLSSPNEPGLAGQQPPPRGGSTTVTVSAVNSGAKQAVQQAFQEELAKHPSDNTKLYQTAVVGNYALQVWAGDIMAGEALFNYDASQGRWVLLDGGGGSWSITSLVGAGVPTSTAQTLLAQLGR